MVPQLSLPLDAAGVRAAADALVSAYGAALDAVAALGAPGSPAPTFESTFVALADAHGAAAEACAEVCFPAFVSGDAEVRAESSRAKDRVKEAFDRGFARADLLATLRRVPLDGVRAGSEEARLAGWYLRELERKGAGLGGAERDAYTAKCAEVEKLCSEYLRNIAECDTKVAFTEEELEGVPGDVVASYPQDGEGRRLVGLKAPLSQPVLCYAKRPETRRRMAVASGMKCVEANVPILERVAALRGEAAALLGYGSHAAYQLEGKMAATLGTASGFLEDIAARVAAQREADSAELQALKEQHEGPGCGPLTFYDGGYYGRLHSLTLGVDEEEVRQHFPLEHVVRSTLAVYEELLGLRYEEMPTAPVWHEDVKAYAARDGKDGSLVGYFYLDLFPREGKYPHQCVYPLRPSYLRPSGERVPPACCIVGNNSRSAEGAPTLLRFREAQTFFHEFGHVMHAVCSANERSPFGWAWSAVPWPGGVEQDFLEVPSMMLENFIFEDAVVKRLSSHHETGAPLPDEAVARIRATRMTHAAGKFAVMSAMSRFDLKIHSEPAPYSYGGAGGLSLQGLFKAMVEEATGVETDPATCGAAAWIHMAQGYDAGYYGYLWSDVYAADCFEQFSASEAGALDTALGRAYRDAILAPCAARDGSQMLESFLGRGPSSGPFLARLAECAA